MNYQGNQPLNIPLWSGYPTQKPQSNILYTDLSDNVWYIGVQNGNEIPLPTYYPTMSINSLDTAVTTASYRLQSPALLMNDTTLTAYGGNLYANGNLIGGITSNSNVSQWANYVAINNINANAHNVFNVSNLSSLTVTTGSLSAPLAALSNLTVSSIAGRSATFSTLTVSSIAGRIANFSTLAVSSLQSRTASISSLTVSSINGYAFSNFVKPDNTSNWSRFPALTDVNMNSKNIASANNVNTQSLNTNFAEIYQGHIGQGGLSLDGNIYMNGTGNTFEPYWYNTWLNANITTADANTMYPPTNSQYFKDWFIGTNCFDIESFGAFTTTKLHSYTAGLIVPTGYIDMRAHNYRSLPVLPPRELKDYRGQVYIGTEGWGAQTYIGINYDNYETLYNMGGSIILNADSVLTNPVGGQSRITVQSARNQILGTLQTEMYAGYAGIDPAYTYFAGFEQWFMNSEGIPAQFLRTRGGVTVPPAGARTDITAECPSDTSVPSQMYIYSSQKANIYTDGDLFIGYGDSTPPYGFNSDQQKVHVINAADIQGRTDTGLDITNTNSVQGLGFSSFITNIHYLVGYSPVDLSGGDLSGVPVYETVTTDPVQHVEFYTSNVPLYYDASGVEISGVDLSGAVFSTLSSFTFSNTYFTTSYVRNNLDISSIRSAPTISRWNEILGISTILSSFILNIDLATVSSIKSVSLNASTIRAYNYISAPTLNVSSITGNYASISSIKSVSLNASTISAYTYLSSPTLNVSSITGNYASNVSTQLGNITSRLSNLSSFVPTIQPASNWYLYPARGSVEMSNNNINNVGILGLVNTATSNTATIRNATRTYSNGFSFDQLAYQDVPFLYKFGDTSIGVASVGEVQFIDKYTGNFNYLNSSFDELQFDTYDSSNNFVATRPVPSTWYKYAADGDINMTQHNISNTNFVQVNLSYFGIPDTTDFVNFRYYDGFMTYSYDEITYTPVASDWYKFPPAADMNFEYFNINFLGYLQVRTIQLYDSVSDSDNIITSANNVLLMNDVPVASTWSNYITDTVDFSGNSLNNVGDIVMSGGILGGTRLANFPTWILDGWATSSQTYITSDFSSRITYSVNGGSVQSVANLNDIPSFPVSCNFTSAGISVNGQYTMVNTNKTLAAGYYRLSYSACGNNTSSSSWSVTSWIRTSTSNGANKLYLNTLGSTVDTTQKYLGNSGITYLSSNGTYNVFLQMSNSTGANLTLSNVNLLLEKMPL
jgi:hypothetical protein